MGIALNADSTMVGGRSQQERVAQLARAILKDQTATRTAIAHYLHDTLIQTLVVLSFTTAGVGTTEGAASGKSASDLIAECCRQARVVTSLLYTPFAGDGDVAELIRVVMENLQCDAGVQVEFRVSGNFSTTLPEDLSRLIFDIVMEYVSVLVMERCTEPRTVLLTGQTGWVNLELPAQWGTKLRTLSILSRIRTEAFGGSLNEENDSRVMQIRLPIKPDESANSDCR
jgi:signal transduction histidine kinase